MGNSSKGKPKAVSLCRGKMASRKVEMLYESFSWALCVRVCVFVYAGNVLWDVSKITPDIRFIKEYVLTNLGNNRTH